MSSGEVGKCRVREFDFAKLDSTLHDLELCTLAFGPPLPVRVVAMIARRLVRVFLAALLFAALPTMAQEGPVSEKQDDSTQETAVSTAETAKLQRQVEQLWQQVELRFATEPFKRQQWRGVLAEALVAWNGSSRGAAEYEQMSAWFAEALEASMPGGAKTPPAAPLLAARVIAEPAVMSPTYVEETLPSPVEEESQVAATVEPNEVELVVETPEPADVKPPDLAMAPAAAPLAWPVVTEPVKPAVVEAVEAAPPVEVVAAKPVDQGNPFVDDPLPVRSVSDASVRVDLRELAVNVRGYNSAVQSIRGELVSEKNPDAAFFARLVRETIQLRSRRSFLELYLNNLRASDLETLPELQAVGTLADEIRSKLDERIDSDELAGSWEHDVLVEIRSDLDGADEKLSVEK